MKTAELSTDEKLALHSLVGHRIIQAGYVNEDEGSYWLKLDNGKIAVFTAVGDDMTWTKFDVREEL